MASSWSFQGSNPITGYTVGLELNGVLPSDVLARVSALGQSFVNDLPRKVEQQAFGFGFPFPTILGQSPPPNRIINGVLFDALERDGTALRQLSVLPNSVTYNTLRYERWKEYWPLPERLLGTVARVILPDVAVSAFMLNAANRFTLSEDRSDMPVNELIRDGCKFVSPDILNKRAPCHSFYGFVSPSKDPPGQMIDNVNVAVTEVGASDSKRWADVNISFRLLLASPISNYASLFTEAPDQPSEVTRIFRILHDLNNKLFVEILKQEICDSIPGLPRP
jgi:uncharacterized protein (TIGR04255 family)